MKQLLAYAAVLFFICANASALDITEYNITFNIMPDASAYEGISMRFAEPLNGSVLNYIITGDISDIAILADDMPIVYAAEKTAGGYVVRFAAPEGTQTLAMRFVAYDLIFAGNDVYSFSAELNPPAADKVNIYAYIPEGFAIYRNVVYPDGYETLSDGQRIYLSWTLHKPQNVMLSFKFYNAGSDYSVAVGAIISMAFIAAIAYLIAHYRKKMKHEFERGFSEDERKVLLIMSQEKRIMQNKIERELRFSRAKMTRLVKKLEAKGLVEKERIGRTNRLFYKK